MVVSSSGAVTLCLSALVNIMLSVSSDLSFLLCLLFPVQDPVRESTSQFSAVETLAAVAVASASASAAASPSHSDDEVRSGEASAASGSGSGTSSSAAQPSNYNISQANRLTGPFMNGDVVVPVPPPASLANPDASVPMAIPPASFLPKGSSTPGGVPSSVRSAAKATGVVQPDTKKVSSYLAVLDVDNRFRFGQVQYLR